LTTWALGWSWSILGLILGAFIAPSLLSHLRLIPSTYHDWAIYAIAAATAIVVQVVSFVAWSTVVFNIANRFSIRLGPITNLRRMPIYLPVVFFSSAGVGLVTLGVEGYALWWYITTHSTHQGLVGVYVLGGFIVKLVIGNVIIGGVLKWLWKQFRRWIGVKENKA
jgi:hypothetical protein